MNKYLSRQDWMILVEYQRRYLRQFPYSDVYPKGGATAVAELRLRGLDARVYTLHRLVRSGKIPRPADVASRARGGYRWHEQDIDAAAEALAAEGSFSPRAHGIWHHFRLDPLQERLALHAAQRRYRLSEFEWFALSIRPAFGLIPARISYYRQATEAT